MKFARIFSVIMIKYIIEYAERSITEKLVKFFIMMRKCVVGQK